MTRCDWIQSRVANSRGISNVKVSASLRTDTLTLEIQLDDNDFAEEFLVGSEK